MNIDSLLDSGAAALAHRLQQRDISAETLTRACLERIAQREPNLRAWAVLGHDQAIARAKELDRGPTQGLLHGLPLGVKDIYDTYDLPTAYGSPIYKGHQPANDAAAVAVCREAGAVVIGKTITTEFATFEPGPTRNPHNPAFTPGGSSSGSAAAVGAGMVPLALGTQTAGSLIRPASYCGIVGYKPSFGMLARAGVKSLCESLDTVGGFGRSVDDVALLVSALSGNRALLNPDSTRAPRVGLCRTPMWDQAEPEVHEAMAQAEHVLKGAGVKIREIELPSSFGALTGIHAEIMAFEAARALADERIRHDEQLGPVLQKMLAQGQELPYERYQALMTLAAEARAQLAGQFKNVEIILTPSAPGVAPLADSGTGDAVFCRLWTLLGAPCIHLPFHQGPHGLPVGLQAIGPLGADLPTLRAAAWVHKRLRG